MSILTKHPLIPKVITLCGKMKPPDAPVFQDLQIKAIHKGKRQVHCNYLAFLYNIFQQLFKTICEVQLLSSHSYYAMKVNQNIF